jgi:SAM-dependent methyltransferase
LADICDHGVRLYNPEQWDLFLKKMIIDRSEILQCQFETWLQADRFLQGDSSLLTSVGEDIYTSHRRLIALEFLEKMSPSARWEYISAGGEGVVFRSDMTAFKYMDGFLLRAGDDSVIKRLIGTDCGVLNLPFHFQQLGNNHVIMKSKFVSSANFFPNGYEKKKLILQMFDFVGECRRHHIVCNNVSKSNFLVTDHGTLHFVDIGIDIADWTAEGEIFMLRRLLLLLFRHTQSNVQELMKESLFNSFMPELSEYYFFCEAMEIHLEGKDVRFFNKVEQIISDLKMTECSRILDYGCGSGDMLHRIARHNLQVVACVGFDPDESHMQSVTSACGCSFQSKRSMLLSKFDLIICLRVICICDDAQAEIVLQDVHEHLDSADSVAIIVIQNPFFANLGDAPCSTAGQFFRPMHVLEHLISKAMLKIVSQPKNIPSISIPDLLPTSDYLLLLLKKDTCQPRRAFGSLVIRTCAMDASTIYFRVIHLVKALISSRDLNSC